MDTQSLISLDLMLIVLAPIGILLFNTLIAVVFASAISMGIFYAEQVTFQKSEVKRTISEQLKYPI